MHIGYSLGLIGARVLRVVGQIDSASFQVRFRNWEIESPGFFRQQSPNSLRCLLNQAKAACEMMGSVQLGKQSSCGCLLLALWVQ